MPIVFGPSKSPILSKRCEWGVRSSFKSVGRISDQANEAVGFEYNKTKISCYLFAWNKPKAGQQIVMERIFEEHGCRNSESLVQVHDKLL